VHHREAKRATCERAIVETAMIFFGYELLSGDFLARPVSPFGLPFWAIAWFDLVTGYLAAMTLAGLTARHRGLGDLLGQVPLMPLYWLLVSAAAYRAAWQFARAPFKWEKTEHGLSLTRPAPFVSPKENVEARRQASPDDKRGIGAGRGNRTLDT
jgi:hypothetical protein